MLFTNENFELVISGLKTQTRRNSNKYYHKDQVTKIKNSETGQYGGWIRIISVREERLGDITLADAIKEGCNSIQEYKLLYASIYGAWEPDKIVEVIDFELFNIKDAGRKPERGEKCKDK